MRVVSYNILDGGEGRADPLAETLIAQRPDVVALVEADDLVVLERIAARLKMDYIHAPGNSHAVALLSRWPIITTINHAPGMPVLSKCLLEAIVATPAGEVVFGVVHLHARAAEENEARREEEIELVLGIFADHRAQRRPHVLLGDFNANSPIQEIDPARLKPATREEMQANGGVIPRRVIQRIERDGYIDTLAAADPQSARTGGTFTTQYPGQRVDYIFAHGIEPARVRSAWIEQDRLATYASDHYPVGAELEIGA